MPEEIASNVEHEALADKREDQSIPEIQPCGLNVHYKQHQQDRRCHIPLSGSYHIIYDVADHQGGDHSQKGHDHREEEGQEDPAPERPDEAEDFPEGAHPDPSRKQKAAQTLAGVAAILTDVTKSVRRPARPDRRSEPINPPRLNRAELSLSSKQTGEQKGPVFWKVPDLGRFVGFFGF